MADAEHAGERMLRGGRYEVPGSRATHTSMRTLTLIGLLLLSTSAFASSQAGGLSWTTPDAFQRQPDRQMRAATYQFPKAKGDADAPELAVFYFGPGQGGGIQANIQRWSEQLRTADGKPVQAKTSVKEVNGLKVHLVEGKGTYRSGGFGAPVVQKPGYQLLGAIVEGPEGAVFFKLTGPSRSVEAARKSFDAMLKSLAVTS